MISCVHQVCRSFEEQTAVSLHSNKHNVPDFGNDFTAVLEVLKQETVFVPTSSRKHKSFAFKCGIMQKIPHKQLLKKVKDSIESSSCRSQAHIHISQH